MICHRGARVLVLTVDDVTSTLVSSAVEEYHNLDYCISNADGKTRIFEGMVGGILMRVLWKVAHGSDQTSWCGAE